MYNCKLKSLESCIVTLVVLVLCLVCLVDLQVWNVNAPQSEWMFNYVFRLIIYKFISNKIFFKLLNSFQAAAFRFHLHNKLAAVLQSFYVLTKVRLQAAAFQIQMPNSKFLFKKCTSAVAHRFFPIEEQVPDEWWSEFGHSTAVTSYCWS